MNGYDQRLAALQRANKVRMARAAIRKEVRAGERPLQDVLLQPDDVVAGVPVADVLAWAQGIGHTKAVRACRNLAGTPVGKLRSDQRYWILKRLPERHRPA